MAKKVLLIMRHGKAEYLADGQSDADRKLVETGIRRTKRIAAELRHRRVIPDHIISSPAARALSTAGIMASELGIEESMIDIRPELYFKSINDYFDTLYTAPESASKILITGHNPLVSDFAAFFLKQAIGSIPTSGLVALESDAATWPEFVIAYRKALFYLIPKQLENEK